MAKYFLIAGEASGDLHAAALIEQLRLRDPEALCTGLGGDRMVAAGCRLHQHIRQMAFMGFAAVLANLGQIRRNFRMAEQALLTDRPDVLILIDYPSFNLRMAQFCRNHLPRTRIIYYIPPKVWAWKRRRVHQIARLCDEVLGIFPFEPAFYARYGYRCTYVGNPTAEQMSALLRRPAQPRTADIAILPGSRPSEISHCLPKMLAAARRYQDYRITVCAAPGIEDAFYAPYMQEGETLTRDTYAAVRSAKAAVVNSGTATLETALLGCPQVAVYHLALSWLIAVIRWAQPLVFSIPYFTLVNIIAGREVIRECVANEFRTDKVAAELGRLLTDEVYTKNMLASYEHIQSVLGTQPAAATAAAIITSKP
jgi:lipid-A-disaccharide synthase